jgi:hypothetical protein
MNISILKKIHYASIAVLLMTIVHHIYGGIIYNTPERFDVVFIAAPAIVIQIIALVVYKKNREATVGKIASGFFFLVSLKIAIVLFGIFEGGYNHLVKIVLYFGGASPALLDRLYSSPIYVMPDDFIFEVTGVAQFFIGAYAAYYVVRLRREVRVDGGKEYQIENL